MAVFTRITENELRPFLQDYSLSYRAYDEIAEGVENSNFLLHCAQGQFILTLIEKRVREEDLPYFVGLMDHLGKTGFPCPRPLRKKNGAAIGRLSGKAAIIVTFLEGKSASDPSTEQCFAAGKTLALLHGKSAGYETRRKNALSLQNWVPMAASLHSSAEKIDPALPALLRDEITFLKNNWPTDLPQGHIHADLFPDNVFFTERGLSGVIDFFFACYDVLAYDLAIGVNAWAFDRKHEFDHNKARRFLSGYQSVRPLTLEEQNSFQTLLRGASLRFLLTRAHDLIHHDASALLKPKDPKEYIRKLDFFRTFDARSLFLYANEEG